MSEEQHKNQIEREGIDEYILTDTVITENIKDNHQTTQSSQIDLERRLLATLELKANDVFFSEGSIDVLIKEIKDELINKAKYRIEETFKSFDVNKIDAQKVIDYAENFLDYLSEYKDYMDKMVNKLQAKPKMKVKSAIEKVFKDSMDNLAKDVAKDVFLKNKAMLKTVYENTLKWYDIYSDTKDVFELTKKMSLHPFHEIKMKLSNLPFYTSS
jgi:hypothetical protein